MDIMGLHVLGLLRTILLNKTVLPTDTSQAHTLMHAVGKEDICPLPVVQGIRIYRRS